MSRHAVVFVLLVLCQTALFAQQSARGPLHTSVAREGTRLASTLSSHDVFANGATAGKRSARSLEPHDGDWNAARQLESGTRVVVTTVSNRRLAGRLVTVDDEALQMQVRDQTQIVRRDDIAELRLGHRLGVGQYAGLGILSGSVIGLVAGSAAACDSNVCGGEGGLSVAGGLVSGFFMGGLGGFVAGEAVHTKPGRLIYEQRRH